MQEAFARLDGRSFQVCPGSAAMPAPAFLGLRTVIYPVAELAKAKAWYSDALGQKPYFDQPFYVGFNVGGFELGLDPDVSKLKRGDNAVAYWGVADAAKAVARLVKLGAKGRSPVSDVGEGIKVATLTDPFGNTLGIIENPAFKDSKVA
jgi:predicted enzyme related to lactoylglutathione lyase